MKILLIMLPLIVLAALLWPLDVALRLADGCLTVRWRPLPLGGWRVSLFSCRVEMPELVRALVDCDLECVVDVLLAGWTAKSTVDEPENADNAEKSTKNAKFERLLLRRVLPGVASALHIRDLRVQVALGGEPFHAAMLAGALQAALHTAFARVSHLVASWRVNPAQTPEIVLLPQPATFSASRIAAECRVRFCVGRMLVAVVGRIIRK